MRLSVRAKIILPFAVLLVFVGVIGTAVAGTETTNAASTQFDARLLQSSLTANQSLSQLDAARTADLRLATDTLGVSEAVAAGEIGALSRLLIPVVGNVTASTAVLVVVDPEGRVMLRIEGGAGGAAVVSLSTAESLAAQPDVMRVLHALPGGTDRRVFVSDGTSGRILYWVAPIRLTTGQTVGAALLGQSLNEIARSMPAAAFYDLAGGRLASAMPNPPVLRSAVRKQMTTDNNAVRDRQTLSGQPFRALFSTWTMRGMQVGYLGVAASEAPLLGLRDQLRLVLTLIFALAAALTLLVGSATAAMLTRPIDALMQSMRVVSGGELEHRAVIHSQDEIGYLAKTFNDVTASLEEKTAALERTAFAAIEALARAIDARDPMTFGHSERVAAISLEIADAMFMPEKEREALRRAALLHDLGKIGIGDQVLRKPGPLNAREADEMREHSQIGYDVLKGLPFLKSSLPGVLYHHERWDGRGYPLGLGRTAIPLQVRILSVADVLDALTSDRPYREGLSFDAAIAAIRNEAGLQFDPDVVSAFIGRRDAIRAIAETMATGGASQAEPEAA
ncbi:MAG: HD domain-containing protein [Chloroflexi bacterium]|nr:MAG: HD domain-containing protein [Chloroflexota bacterium]